jgi:hypothetical protein
MNTTTRAPDIPGLIELQKQLIARNQGEHLGRVKMIVLDPDARPAREGATPADNQLNFYGVWPSIAQTEDHSQLLFQGIRSGPPFLRPDGSVGLPAVPVEGWARPQPTVEEQQSLTYRPPDAPMTQQPLSVRARGFLPYTGGRFYVCGPVSQILLKPDDLPQGWILECGADAAGRQMELFIDEKTGEAFFLFGQFRIRRIG